MPTWRRMLVVACLAALVAGACSGSDDPEGPRAEDESGWPGAGDAPQVLVGVSDSEPPGEYEGSDLYLVELGEPVDDATLVVERAFGSTISVRSITDNGAAPMPLSTSASNVVALPDGRVLVGWGRIGAGDTEYFAEIGASVVDPVSGRVDDVVHLEDGGFQQGDTFVWDPDVEVLWMDGGTCFGWDDGAPGSGFTEGECPAIDPPPDGVDELDDWDFSCCAPFEIADRESGEVVFTDDGVANPSDVGAPLPQFLDQREGTMLFTVPSSGGVRLLVLSPGGSVAEIGEWESGPVVDAVTLGARLVDGAVLYSEEATERSGSVATLSRYTIDSGDAEPLLEGSHLTWAVVGAEEPWVIGWEEPDQVDEEMVTTVWTGPAVSGPLAAVGELDHAKLSYGDPWVDPSTGTVLFTTDRLLTVAGSERQATRLWRLAKGVEPVEVQRGAQIQVLATTDEGRSVLLTSLPDGCTRHEPACQSVLRLVEPDGVSDLATGVGGVWFLDDGETLAFGRSVGPGDGAPYESEIVALTLDDPDGARTWYGPGSSATVPYGASLGVVVGASSEGNLDVLPVCSYGCDPGEDLPWPGDLFACTFFPEELGC